MEVVLTYCDRPLFLAERAAHNTTMMLEDVRNTLQHLRDKAANCDGRERTQQVGEGKGNKCAGKKINLDQIT